MKKLFHLVLIKPTHYDDDGYPIQWLRSTIPSNSLACVYGIATEASERNLLGADVEIKIHAIDETNAIVRPKKIIRMIEADGGSGLICMIGVQSNQFPRSMDLAKPFLEAGLLVCNGGFHASGCISMLPELPPEIVAAQELGVSFFAGEAEEGRLDEVLLDAYAGKLKPLYDHVKDMPGLGGAPIPILLPEHVERTYGNYSSFDLGRGCPFQCSFCTIINVQGRKSRFRDVDDLEKIVRHNHTLGIKRFFLTDDNLARNKNWEAFFDRLIELKENDGLEIIMTIQVDTLCHKIPNFIDKAVAAGVEQVFIGMENINPDNLLAVQKRQNKITDYRDLLLAWKKYPVIITAGYIIGFPNDTRESILRDIEIIKEELPIDTIYFTNLTPLPGSADHLTLWRKGEWMDEDLNKYDLNHRVTHHQTMSDAEWDQVYDEVWDRFYTREHMETVLKRMVALGSNKKNMTVRTLIAYREFRKQYGVHPLEGGFFRMKSRIDRRPGMKRESIPVFYALYFGETIRAFAGAGRTYFWLMRRMKKLWVNPALFEYSDLAITPTSATETDDLQMYQATRGGTAAVTKVQRYSATRKSIAQQKDAPDLSLQVSPEVST